MMKAENSTIAKVIEMVLLIAVGMILLEKKKCNKNFHIQAEKELTTENGFLLPSYVNVY